MSIVEKMRGQLPAALRAHDAVKLNFLRYWIAQLTLGTGLPMSDEDSIKKMRGVLKEARAGTTTFTEKELTLLAEWVPVALAPEQVRTALESVAAKIKAAPKDGMAMGIAMKALAGQAVESEDVKSAVAAIRG
jgi:uncharacterized protein YqeY